MRVGCVVVTHNSASEIPSLLLSLATLDIHALAVADNASRDGTVDVLRGRSAPFEVIVLQRRNDGYAAGANAAVRELRERGVDLVVLLNPDTVVLRADLPAVRELFATFPGLGSLCPVMVASDRRTLDSVGLRLTPWASVADAGQGTPYRDLGTTVVRGVIGPCGGGAVYRARALETLEGPFDERFFLYYEDADLALRLRRQGWSTVTSDSLTLEHRRSGLGSLRYMSAGPEHGTALRHRQRSYELFVRQGSVPLGRRLLGRPAARARRFAVRARSSVQRGVQAG